MSESTREVSAATTTLEIESIAAGGDGVGRANGLAVFVPRTAPGDVARVRLDHRGRFARGQLLGLERSSPDRIEPPCAHYTRDRCGGCQLQHLSYEAQLAAKSRIIGDALSRIGRRDVGVPRVRSSPAWRYRRKLTLALHWRGDRWVAGLHPYDAPASVFELVDCPITATEVLSVWREVLAAAALLPRAPRLRASVQIGPNGASLSVEGGRKWNRAQQLLEQVRDLVAVYWMPEGERRRPVARRDTASALASFVQVNAAVAADLRDYVVRAVQESGPASVIDAYAGSGDTAVQLAQSGVRVVAIELDAEAARFAATRLPTGSRAIVGHVEREIGAALPADAVILNPPRAGVHEDVTRSIDASHAVRRVVYVSCNPATLARDLSRMPSLSVSRVEAFDMFPQTAHVETVCVLDRAPAVAA